MSDRDLIDDLVGDNDDQPTDLVPAVDVPEPDPGEDALDGAVAALFWRLVLVFNVALFGVTVGPMMLYFRGNLRIGGGLLAVGLLFAGYGFARYWAFKRERLAD
ncbi:DUF7322 domain-containing protein [Halorhabdus salina]|uniref:DUF7322 domain-containing protein n=1 Tax=Halorhabdus salina TaxID=2750670 RepID=UPI0015EF10DE|nr:hypothetical protein [Halorhabdus salina]